MEYDVLTFDTQTVETNGFDFDGKLLAQLKQFAKGPPEIILSEIVEQEVLRHLQAQTLKAKDAMENAYRKSLLYGLKLAADKPFADTPDPVAIAKSKLSGYLKEIGATIIPAKIAPMDEVIRRYHQSAPPFSTGKKKAEFPDAIALVSLEQFAKEKDKRILAVSGDKDWQAFGDKSDYIDVVAELEDALTKLQEDADKAAEYVQRAIADIKSDANSNLARQFKALLSDGIPNANVTAEGSSAYQFETDSVEVQLDHYELDENPDDAALQIVQASRNIIVASFSLQVFVNADASFSLSTWDSIDDEWVGLGPTYSRKENEECDIRVLMTLEGDFAAGEIDITKVELIDGLDEINFGEIEIDYGDPDYGDESAEPEEAGGSAPPVDENQPF